MPRPRPLPDMLDRRHAEGRAITASDLDLVGRALSSSDDAAMNVLWGRYDGIGAVRRVTARLGLSATRAPSDPSQWGDTVTAGDLVRIYRHILRDMAPDDRDVIVGALAAARPSATVGFGQFFGLLSQGASDQVYAKQAWVPYRPSGFLLHSAGVVHDRTGHAYAIALLSIQTYIGSQAARDRLSRVAAAALDALGAARPSLNRRKAVVAGRNGGRGMPGTRWQGNGLILAVLRSPAHRLLSGMVIELRYTGRRSGREYSVPVQYARAGDRLVVVPQRASSKTWWRNSETPRPVTVRLRGRVQGATARVVRREDPAWEQDLQLYRARWRRMAGSVTGPLVEIALNAAPA